MKKYISQTLQTVLFSNPGNTIKAILAFVFLRTLLTGNLYQDM